MRFVKKGAEPAALRAFKANNKTTPEVLVYSSLSAGVRSALYRSMLAEQGKLCAYTMMPIGRHLGNAPRDFHIEHVQPRWCHRERELDYNNMVLCALGDNRAGGEFGARKKDDADVNDADFVAPLNASCETRLNSRVEATSIRPMRTIRPRFERSNSWRSIIRLLEKLDLGR